MTAAAMKASAWPKHRDMTPEQIAAWGVAEAAARKADLTVRGAAGLAAGHDPAEHIPGGGRGPVGQRR